MEMWLRFAAHGALACINAVQAIYRLHHANMSNFYVGDYQERKDAFDSFFAEYANHLPSAGILQAQSDRVLAESAFWTGIAQLCRGNVSGGRWLLGFAINLRPSLRFWPPIMRVAQKPDMYKHVRSVFRDSLGNFFGWTRQNVGVTGTMARQGREAHPRKTAR